MKKNKLGLLSLLGTLLLSSCGTYNPLTYYASVHENAGEFLSPLNTSCSMTVQNSSKYKKLTPIFEEYIWSYHEVSDIYHHYSDLNNLYDVNLNVGEEIRVDSRLYQMIKAGIRYTKLTKGYFNIALGSVTDLYEKKMTKVSNEDVSDEDLSKALTAVPSYEDIDKYVILNDTWNSIKLVNPEGAQTNIKLNVGGFAKGYIADMIAYETSLNNEQVLINLGNSSLHAIGKNPNPYRDTYTVAIENPVDSQADYIYKINLNANESISTSADNQRCYYIKVGDELIKKHHIINPFTGRQEEYHHLISLVNDVSKDNPGLLDALSTALFNIPTSDIAYYLNKIGINCKYVIFDDEVITNYE